MQRPTGKRRAQRLRRTCRTPAAKGRIAKTQTTNAIGIRITVS